MHPQLWGNKVEEKLYVGVREQKRLNTAELDISDYLFVMNILLCNECNTRIHLEDLGPLASDAVSFYVSRRFGGT
jgi:hypothetical protein